MPISPLLTPSLLVTPRILGAVALAVLLSTALPTAWSQNQPLTSSDWSSLEHRSDLVAPGELEGAVRVLRFVQVSDAHILDDDAPSPMRVEFLDPLGPPFESASRPQDEYTDEVLAAMVASINTVHAEDQLDFVINTGDNIDNELENELMRFIDLWEGTHTTTGPVSGIACVPDGQSIDWNDRENDETNQCTSLPEALAGNHPALAPGLPWFGAFGNHDGLIQGNVPIEPGFQEAAAQFGRYFLSQPEFVGMHFEKGESCIAGSPMGSAADDNGHGYGFAADRLCDENPDNDGYYAFDVRGVRFVVLDTVNDDFVTANENLAGLFNPQSVVGNDLIGGYSEGSVDPVQFQWLLDEIDANKDRLVVVLSHHTVNSMFSSRTEGNCGGGQCLDDLLTAAGYKTGPEITEVLAEHSNVVAWFGGHTHQHRIQAKSIEGAAGPGFWNVESSSLIDMPQEVRVVELWMTADGTKGFWAMTRLGHNFELSKNLAKSDTQVDASVTQGTPSDQDVLLWFDIPSGVALEPQPSVIRVLDVTMVEPALEGQYHGLSGDSSDLIFEARDSLLNVTVPGLQGNASVLYGATDNDMNQVGLNATVLLDLGDGRYSVPFSPEFGATFYVQLHMTDPSSVYEDVARTLSLSIEPRSVTAVPDEKSPGYGAAAVLLVLGALVLVAKRRRH